MTVKELIEILNTYNPEHRVFIETVINNVDIDHVNPIIAFNVHTFGVIIAPENQ